MRPAFLDLLAPHCPRCAQTAGWKVDSESGPGPTVWHGRLLCADTSCGASFPVIDGVPVFTARPAEILAQNAAAWLRRDDLPADIEHALNAAAGPSGWSDAPRQQLSTYAWDHYGDLDPEAEDEEFPPGSVVRLLDEALALLPDLPEGPVLDAGCAVGRTTLHLAAKTRQPTLGVDLNPVFLRAAQQVFCRGRILYDLRRNGLAYLRRDHEVILPALDQSDAWLCDATTLPFADGTFGMASCLHTLDSCGDPSALLRELARVVMPGGYVLASTPYDWSAAVTPPAQWWGGSAHGGDPAVDFRVALDQAGLEILEEREDVPWTLRLHDRAGMHYRSHVVAARVL